LKNQLLKFLLQCLTFLGFPYFTLAQFAPPAGQPGSTAIFKDSSLFVNWAKTCSIQLGYVDITDTSVYYGGSNKANFGVESDVLGKSDDHVVSLGDGGKATLTFDPPIVNGTGYDFAVFENGMSDSFLELGFVEVSSDGIQFVRFPSTSLTPESPQISTFGFLDAAKINNLAGKYRVFFGTPFDLEELKDSSGLDLRNITHVRIIDVVGCVSSAFTTFDSYGHKINDPWPTHFNTGGFDLDAVGVIHESSQGISENQKNIIRLYPNPFQNHLHVTIPEGNKVIFQLINILGDIVADQRLVGSTMIDLTSLNPGIYIGQFTFQEGRIETHKIIKR
jgi:hypothetical protein